MIHESTFRDLSKKRRLEVIAAIRQMEWALTGYSGPLLQRIRARILKFEEIDMEITAANSLKKHQKAFF